MVHPYLMVRVKILDYSFCHVNIRLKLINVRYLSTHLKGKHYILVEWFKSFGKAGCRKNKNVKRVLKEEEVPKGTSWKMYEGKVSSVT